MAASITPCRLPEDFEPHLKACESLAADLIEPNPFYEPWILLPAWRAFGAEGRPFVLVVYKATTPVRARLNGVFVFERASRFHGMPVSVLRSWSYRHNVLGTPLLRAGTEHDTLHALFEWLEADPAGASLVEFGQHAADGRFNEALAAVLRERQLPSHVSEAYQRALLIRRQGAGESPPDVMSSGNRKELRRQRRRLEEAGRLEVRTLDARGDAEPWIRDFMTLERSGWKGREASAMGSDAVQREYFEQIARSAHARGRLMLIGLFLDDQPIAMKFNLLAAPGSFAFKIAFDEKLGRFSPGVQLELENMSAVAARSDLEWMDSCASHSHFMIERLWSDRRAIATTIAATGRSRSASTLVRALPAVHGAYKKTRPARRALRDALSRRMR